MKRGALSDLLDSVTKTKPGQSVAPISRPNGITGQHHFALRGAAMTNRPWMPLYVAEYRADTAHLSAAQHGAYLLLIMSYWSTGGLPDDDGQLARIACMTPAEWKRTRPVVQPFFIDGWKHKRVEFELTEAARISAAGKAGGQASGRARRERSTNDQPNDQRTTDERSFNDQGNDPPTKREALHLHLPKKEREDTADAVSTPIKYAFESGTIRLTQKDFDQWKQSFTNLDLGAELLALTDWASQQSKWFHAVSGALAKRNREVKLKLDQNKNATEADGLTADERYWGKNRIPGIQ